MNPPLQRFHKQPYQGKRRWLEAFKWLRDQAPCAERDFLIAVANKKCAFTFAPKVKPVAQFVKIKDTLLSECEALCKAIVFNRDKGPDGLYTCITHPTIFKSPRLQWGHFIEQHKSAWLRFDPRNCAAQCGNCNGEWKGRPREFGEALDRIYGQGFADGLRQEAKDMRTWKPTVANLEATKKRLLVEIRGLGIPFPDGVIQ